MRPLPRPADRHVKLSLLDEDPLTFSGAWMSVIYGLITEQGAALAVRHGAITPGRCFSVFLAIARNDAVSIADLADLHGFSHQLMRTRLVELEQLGLIKSHPSKEDKRKVALRLTPKGRADLSNVEAACAQATVGLRAAFDEARIDATALPRLVAALIRRPLWIGEKLV